MHYHPKKVKVSIKLLIKNRASPTYATNLFRFWSGCRKLPPVWLVFGPNGSNFPHQMKNVLHILLQFVQGNFEQFTKSKINFLYLYQIMDMNEHQTI